MAIWRRLRCAKGSGQGRGPARLVPENAWLWRSRPRGTRARPTRLIAVTGYGQEHDRNRTRAAGFDAHLVKPVDIQQVSELIVELLGTGEPMLNRRDRK